MLIIFDLDDTLIDTSGCLTYYQLEEALNAMVREGLVLPDFSGALSLLRRLDKSAQSAKEALAEFVEILEIDNCFFEIGLKRIYDSFPEDLPVFALDGVAELLRELQRQHQIALVTLGNGDQQMQKLKKAGIDSQIFSKIVVTQERNKKLHYQKIVDDLGYSASQVLVCGDRISLDLTPAKELGFRTVQMKWGRGLNSHKGSKADVDYTIFRMVELGDIVTSLTIF